MDKIAIEAQPSTCQLDIQHWYRRVYAQCQSRLLSMADAEDAAQETFVRALSRIDELRSQAAFGSWLRQIACHVCIDMIRRQKLRRTTSTDVQTVADLNCPENAVIHDQQEHIVRLVHALPEPLREIILLHYYEDMTYDEMAIWLDVARSTVNDRLSRARHMLKLQISAENAP